MRWRVLLVLSLAANLGLALGWLAAARRAANAASVHAPAATNQTSVVRTNVLFRRQFFTWSEIESPDYVTFITNLRDIACPEQTIRDIIIADVNALYARRRALEVLTPEQQWWRAAPDPAVQAAANLKLRELDDERRVLLTRLLGAGWDSGDQISLPRPTRAGLNLDGPILGALPAEVKQALQEIAARSQDRLQAYLDAQRRDGKPVDPVELAKLRQQTRDQLARLLSAQQLEEFLLRFSQNATALRTEMAQLQFFNLSQDEFRQLFRARDAFDLQLALLGDATDSDTAGRRTALERQRDNAIKLALGEQRYADYLRLHDAAYRDAYAQAQQAGTPEAAGPLYEIRQAVEEEQQRIRNNTDLTEEQKAIELKRIELEQLMANALALGQELPPEPPKPPMPTRNHTFRERENLIGLALMYDVPVSSIVAANPGLDFNKLKLGEVIKIPTTKR
jgi:LysM repeat protein